MESTCFALAFFCDKWYYYYSNYPTNERVKLTDGYLKPIKKYFKNSCL